MSFLNEYRQHMSVVTVVECIQLDCGKPILLAVDEVAIAGGRIAPLATIPFEVVHAVGKCLNNFRGDKFNAVVSTLDVLIVGAEKAYSGRPITWIQLPRFTRGESEQLFGNPDTEVLLCMFIMMCNGHGRTLEHLHKVWKNNAVLFATGTISSIMSILIVGMQSFNFLSMSLALIKPALLHNTVNLDDTPAGGNQTYRACIDSGVVLLLLLLLL